MKPQSHSQRIIGSSEHTFKRVTFRHAQVIRVKEAAHPLGVATTQLEAAELPGKNLRHGAFSHQSRGASFDASASDGAFASKFGMRMGIFVGE